MSVYPMPPLPSDDKRWKIVNGTMRRHGYARNALIETLHTVQSSFGCLDDNAIRFVARSLHVPLSQAYGVATFYHHFSLKPAGKHTCTVCIGTACYIKGADKLVAAAEKEPGIKPGGTTRRRQHLPHDRTLRGRLRPRSGHTGGRRADRARRTCTGAAAVGRLDSP